jgi:hypothetical protein
MKKNLLFVSVLMSGFAANAQNRLVLEERYSQASCGPCASQNPAFHTLTEANLTKAIAIKYQTSWPGVDPMNAQNAADPAARVTYYGISGVPDTREDGADVNVTQTTINNRYAVPSPYTLALSHTFSSDFDSVYVTANITAVANLTAGTSGVAPLPVTQNEIKFRLAMIEKEITFSSAPGSNGETAFHNVVRKMYPSATGTAMAATWTIGQTQTINFAIAIPSYIYQLGQIGFVGFIQEDGAPLKEVHQAGVSVATNPLSDAKVSAVSVSSFACVDFLNGVGTTLMNECSIPITSATVKYQVDLGTIMSTPFTGSIAVGGTTPFTLPNITGIAAGSHTLKVWMENINAQVGFPIGGTYTANFNVYTTATGSGTPIAQNFSVATFPYAGYGVTGGSPWIRATANGGSAKHDNYNIPAGGTSDMILPPMDMTANPTMTTMTFDVAYAQYAAELDKLEVKVSTNCGSTWTTLYTKSGATLATVPAQTAGFTPATASQWRNESVNLSSVASSNKVFVKFVATSAYGNNLYVDNINLAAAGVGSLNDNEISTLQVYPNPATDVLNVNFDAKGGNYTITVNDLTGRVASTTVITDANGTQAIAVPVSTLSNGNYLVTVSNGTLVSTKHVTISK